MPHPDTQAAAHAAMEAAANEIPDCIADAADDLRTCWNAAHRFTCRFAGEDIADAAMRVVVERLLPHQADLPWRKALDAADLELISETPIGRALESAAAYGENGVVISPGTDAETRAVRIRETIEEVEAFDAAIPRVSWGVDAPAIARIVRMARGRWSLDHGEPIEAMALAHLGGVSERRIRNMMSTGEAGLQAEKGRVTAASALAWLTDREGFRPSAWRHDTRFDAAPRSEPLDRDEVRFVPATEKGEMFHPGLKRDGVFIVCEGDKDIDMENYELALELLQTLQPPTWRRPGPGGRWTRVKGHKWERITRRDLDEIARGRAEGER